MGLPNAYQRGGEGAVASYDSTDIADGTGSISFYGASTQISGATAYITTKEAVYSATVETARSTQGVTTMNFDTSAFNLPRTAKGTAYFNCALGAAQNILCHVSVTIQKYDGTTATNISSGAVVSPTLTGGITAASQTKEIHLPIPLTQTLIKKGEQLRAVVAFDAENNGACEIGHDPQNRTGTHILTATQPVSSKMIFYVPFKIDL